MTPRFRLPGLTPLPLPTMHYNPSLATVLKPPLQMLPEHVCSAAVVGTLNTILSPALAQDELDFLEHLSVSIMVSDLNLKFALTLHGRKLVASRWQETDDLNLTGNLYDFLLLATRNEDSDTLFFQRKLKMSGDTELGLEVKNLLDGLDSENVRFRDQIDSILAATLALYRKLEPGH